MMGVIRARTRKATVLPRQIGPVNWYIAPVELKVQPFRFPWSTETLRKILNASLRASPNARADYKFKFVQISNRYWKEPVGYPRALPIARWQEYLDHQLQHLDLARVHQRIEVAAQARKRNLSRHMAPLQYEHAWHPQGKMMMSGDMPLVQLDVVNSVLGPELRAEWYEECLSLEISIFETWKRAYGLWKQAGWVSKRVALAATSRAGAEGSRNFAPPPQPNPTPTMAMSLEQPLTVEAAPADEVRENAAMLVIPDQSGEHAAELTPNAALVDPIGGLTIDTDTDTNVPSPTRRAASTSEASPSTEVSPRIRHK